MIAQEKTAAGKLPRVRQVAYVVPRAHKAAALQRVLDMESPTSALVFCRTRLEVDSLVETLNAHGYRAEALHGGMQQQQRDAVMERFRAAKADLLIATDVAARGLDIEQLSHVFNYDVPSRPTPTSTASAAPAAPAAKARRSRWPSRASTGCCAASSASRSSTSRSRAVPTVADLRAQPARADPRVHPRAQLVDGELDDVRVVVESLASEFDIVDVAAAAVKLAHDALTGDAEDQDVRDRAGPA